MAMVLGGGAGAAMAAGPARGDKSGYSLFNPTPRELMREMSTDRPDTTESPYSLDAGHVQFELSVVDHTRDRRNSDDESRHSLAVLPMLIKVGLTNRTDIQLGVAPYTIDRAESRADGTTSEVEGFSDTIVRLKVNLWGNDDTDEGATALAVMPYVSIPTGRDGLSSRHLDGGVIVPFAAALPADFALGAMVQLDWARSQEDDRAVFDFVHTVTVGHDIIGDLGGYIEYAGFANLNHDEEYRGYFDAGLTYAISEDIQVDGGVRFGLTRAADDVGLFVGLSWRF